MTDLNLIEWAQRALREDISFDELAECLPYFGAGELEASALVDALADRGWMIVPLPRASS